MDRIPNHINSKISVGRVIKIRNFDLKIWSKALQWSNETRLSVKMASLQLDWFQGDEVSDCLVMLSRPLSSRGLWGWYVCCISCVVILPGTGYWCLCWRFQWIGIFRVSCQVLDQNGSELISPQCTLRAKMNWTW